MHSFGLEVPFFEGPLHDVPDKFANYDTLPVWPLTVLLKVDIWVRRIPVVCSYF